MHGIGSWSGWNFNDQRRLCISRCNKVEEKDASTQHGLGHARMPLARNERLLTIEVGETTFWKSTSLESLLLLVLRLYIPCAIVYPHIESQPIEVQPGKQSHPFALSLFTLGP